VVDFGAALRKAQYVMIVQYACALQAPLLLVYSVYFRGRLPSLSIVPLLELMMVVFGPY
jgi:hypothetical protein